VFDVLPSPEDWLVLGKKKGYYIANPDKAEEQEIVLVPMRPGALFLPNVAVSLLPSTSRDSTGFAIAGGEASGQEGQRLMCETYVSNAAETVRVLPAKGSVTALVPLEPAWEVEAERRM